MLERSIRAYRNRTIEAAQVIEELIQIAKEMRQAQDRGNDLGLSDEELAFYDALDTNDSAVEVLGNEMKCHRLFRPKISKVKPSFFVEIP